MKNTTLALMMLTMLSLGVANAQLTNNGATKTDRPERGPNPEVQAMRGEIKEARGEMQDMREDHKEEMMERKEDGKEMREDMKAQVEAGEMTREEAKATMDAEKEAGKAAMVENKEERAAKKDDIVSKRQGMIDTRIAAVRERSPEMADLMENYYGQIMAKVSGLQTQRDELIAGVKAGTMTTAEARESFKATATTEKAAIKALITEMKEAVKAMKGEMKAASDES